MSDRPRVLFVLGSMAGGGAERQTLTYLRHLDRSRFAPSLYLIARRGELLDDLPGDVPVFAFEDNYAPPRLYFPGRIARQQAQDLAGVIERERFDLLVTVAFPMTLLGAAAVRRCRRPVPWLAVEMADPRRDFAQEVRRFRFLKRRLLRQAYRTAQPVAVSAGVAQGLTEFHAVPPERIALLPNFIDTGDLARRAAEARPNLAAGCLHVACVGRLQAQKGHTYLIAAAERLVKHAGLERLHLHFLGQGPLRESLEEQVRHAGLEAHVTFAGFVHNPPAYVSRCDLFCLPSLYEGLPVALLEAMACGVPVVATDCPSGPREVLDGGRCGRLVPVADVPRLAAAIAAAAADPRALAATAVAARARIEQEYSHQVGIARLQRLLAEHLPDPVRTTSNDVPSE